MKPYLNISFTRLVRLLLPAMLHQPLLLALLDALVAPLANFKLQFDRFVTDVEYNLAHNGQVCYLQAALNDAFDPIRRRITITDNAVQGQSTVIYLLSEEDRPLFVPALPDRILLQMNSFIGSEAIDFVVNIPADLSIASNDTQLNALVRYYRLAGMRYSVIMVDG